MAVWLPPWSTLSCAPVTVTVWAVFQLDGVKVKVAGLTVAAPVSPDSTAMVTSALGRLSSTTV